MINYFVGLIGLKISVVGLNECISKKEKNVEFLSYWFKSLRIFGYDNDYDVIIGIYKYMWLKGFKKWIV